MELQVLDGNWGLPSLDKECLAVLAYCKFSEVPLTITKSNNLWKSPTGSYPVLIHDDQTKTNVSAIFDHLREQNWGTDSDLTSKQSADIVAFTSLLTQKLQPALDHLQWIDGRTYTNMTRSWYGNMWPFPLGNILPAWKQRATERRVYNLKGEDLLTDEEREAKVVKEAKECLNLLSNKLGKNDFFFGKMPTSLDAIVFGYLAELMKVPYPNTTLQNHLKGCPNLISFCRRILSKYFPLSPEEQEAEKKREEAETKRQQEALDFPNRKRNMMIAAVVAVSAMLAFSYVTGKLTWFVSKNGRGNPAVEAEIPDPEFNEYDYEDNEQEQQ